MLSKAATTYEDQTQENVQHTSPCVCDDQPLSGRMENLELRLCTLTEPWEEGLGWTRLKSPCVKEEDSLVVWLFVRSV